MRMLALTIALVALCSTNVHAAITIGGLYNTGMSASGVVLPYGSIDPHYTIVSSPDGAPLAEKTMDSSGGFPIPPWVGDDHLSRWDSESTDGHGNEGTGTFDNQTTFVASGPGIATITGQWATDDSGTDILINGVSTGATAGGFGSWTPFSITGVVHAGVNTLDFLQVNGGGPGGIRVEFFSPNPAPEPASFAIWGAVIAGGLLVAPRRRTA